MSAPKPTVGQSFRMSEGDWICEDQNCQNINFARRMSCNLCGKDKPLDARLKDKESASKESAEKKRKVGHEIGKVAAEKSKGLFSADDWQCGRCGNVNWARRSTCNMCSAPKFSDNEERTGLGGGYNEREEHVEYKQRADDSDDEYDDFGRRKKKVRKSDHKPDNDTNSTHNRSDDNSADDNRDDEEGDDDEDDDSADVSKYKLESDDEDEEEEDDGDEDLSKYDLSDCLEDKK